MKTTVFHASTAVTALAILACAAVLSGCTPTPPQEIPGLTYAERKLYVARERDRSWRQIGLAPGTRAPDIDPIEYVDEEIYGTLVSSCIVEFDSDDLHHFVDDLVGKARPTDREYVRSSLEWWICQGRYPIQLEDITLLSSEQLTALYEHYENFTIPCLIAKGYRIYSPPERGSFTTEGWPSWSPLDALILENSDLEPHAYVQLAIECRVHPDQIFAHSPLGDL